MSRAAYKAMLSVCWQRFLFHFGFVVAVDKMLVPSCFIVDTIWQIILLCAVYVNVFHR